MRVLHVYSGNLYGGVETLLVTLARCRVLAPGMRQEYALCFTGRLTRELLEAEVPVHALPPTRLRYPWSVRAAREALEQLLRQRACDVVICHSAWSLAVFAPAVKRVGVPLVFWAHDASDGDSRLDRRAARMRPELIIANSRYTAERVRNWMPGLPQEVLYLPSATVCDPPVSDAERRQLRQALKVPDGRVIVIQVSRMEPWKGHELHLRALSRLRDLPNWECWLVGGAQRSKEVHYLQQLQHCSMDLGLVGRIRFLGQRSDVPLLLRAADIHCQPNTGPEPFGLTFIEAMAAGLPVVTTAMGAALEIVTEECGILVSPDAGQLAAALRTLMSSAPARAALASHAPARARSLCDPAAAMPAIARILNDRVCRSAVICSRSDPDED